MIIHFNGMPGVGKLTIAKALATKTGGTLIDNHMIIDVVVLTHPRGTPEYRPAVQAGFLNYIRNIAAEPDTKIYILTNALANELPEDRELLDAIANATQHVGHSFIQVLVECDWNENLRRVVSDDRATKGKLRDAALADELRKKYTIYHPPAEHRLTIDSSQIEPEVAAGKVADYIKQLAIS
jgi:adenylylsulfate kinase-like enzyme